MISNPTTTWRVVPPLVRACFGVVAFTALLAGCGDPGPATYEVSGTVTWKKNPLVEGDIMLIDPDGKANPAAGKIVNGEFRFRSTPGKKRIQIVATREKSGPVNKAMGSREREQYIPDKCNSKSTLSEQVAPDGKNQFKFDLE